MTGALRPRQVAHRGSVIACGYVLDAAALGVAEARRRALALWTPGARVLDAGELVVVTDLAHHRVRAELAPGAPLVDTDGVLAAAPLTAAERAALPGDAVVVIRGGLAEALADATAVDVGAWLELGDAAVIEVAALAAPPAPVVTVPPPPTLDLRRAVGVGAPADGAAGLAAALARADGGGDGRAAAAPEVAPSRWQRLVGWLARRLTRPAAGTDAAASVAERAGRAAGDGGGGTSTALAPAAPSWWSRLRARLAEAAWRSKLGELLGRRHAEYLQRMLDMFDRGDLDEALRHAIPLGGGDGPSELGLAAPRPRDRIAPSLAPRRGSQALPVGLTAAEQIRARYRQALDRLEREGRIEEAAFVLADLLGDVAGAVALLERHRRFALAAQLAHGRGLDAGLVVRLWWLADERARAVAVARRHGAWADALARLERAGEAEAAATLRLTWAEHAASAGAYALAVQLAARLAPARALVLAWIERGLAVGGTDAGRLLIAKLDLAPARFDEIAPAVTALLADASPDGIASRRVLAEAMLAAPASAALAALARPTVRALARDVGRGADGDAPTLLPRLIRVAADDALRTDLPPLRLGPRAAALVDRPAALARRWSASDRGAVAIHDAARLPGGRVLVALGELGVRLLGRDGATLATFDQPATALVIGDGGGQALATARRGGYLRVARLDLATRRGRWWCDAECDGGADTYDGDVWLTTRQGEVLAIDATAARWTATWGVDTERLRCTIARDGDRFSVEATDFDLGEAWHYERFVLRERKDLGGTLGAVVAYQLALVPTPRGWVAAAVRAADAAGGPGSAELVWPTGLASLPFAAPLAVVGDAHFVAAVQGTATGVVVTIAYRERSAAVASLHLDGATRARVRLADLYATVCDDRGRVIVIDLRTGAVPLDARLAP